MAGLLVAAVAACETRSDLSTLYADVGSGQVDRVELVGGLWSPLHGPIGTAREGSAHLDVRWRAGGDRRTAVLVEVAGRGTTVGTDGREVTRDDVAARLRALDPGVQVYRRQPRGGVSTTFLRVPLAGPAALAPLVVWLLSLVLVSAGPEPWRATHWAWFWLLTVPGGPLALCLLAGPFRGVPAPRRGRRLTGGWAFLLVALVAGGAHGVS